MSTAAPTYVASTTYKYDGLARHDHARQHRQTGETVQLLLRQPPGARHCPGWTLKPPPGTFITKHSTDYAYDNAGNITYAAGMTDGIRDQVECFTYDHLRRLTEAWTQAAIGSGCVTPQRTGADPYRRQWPISSGYDKLGNRLQQIDKDSTDTTWNYTIGGVDSCGGASKPHAVTSVTAAGPKAGTPTRTFCYDAGRKHHPADH